MARCYSPAVAFRCRDEAERHGPPTQALQNLAHLLQCWDELNTDFPCDKDHHADRQTVHNTLDYIWRYVRSAVLVVVREGRVRLFAPFVNPDFTNDWHHQLRATEHVVGPAHLPKEKWWCNAGILCTQCGFQPWSDSMNECYRHMIEAVVRHYGVRTWDGILNRRDHPIVRHARPVRLHPYAHVWADTALPNLPEPFATCELLPVLSPYTHPADFEDCAIPCNLDWERMLGLPVFFAATNVALCQEPTTTVPWEQRRAVAFFRGSGTSTQRLRVAERYRSHPLFDIKVWHSRNGRYAVHGGVVTPPSRANRKDFVPSSEWGRYRVLISMDGHAAPNRIGALIAGGGHILVVRDPESPGPHLWWYDEYPQWFHIVDEADIEEAVRRLLATPPPPPRPFPQLPPRFM
ncbi:MAG: hypothetical protein CL902_00665 [Dehalococcoidia bacterium]|nr:hypothetical protein [Dehalococcoidia bacterium]